MLIGEVFEEFISVVKENNHYTIGLVDEKQIVILCSNKVFIGKSINVNHPDKKNLFYEVQVKNRNFGYLWVSGEDDNLQMISKLFYESLTVRLMYEINQATLNRKTTKDDELVKCLLNIKDFDMHQILQLFDELELNKDIHRSAIYVINDEGFNTKDVMRLKMRPDSKETIYSLLNSKCLLIYKDVPMKYKEIDTFKEYISNYIKSIKEWQMNDCYYFVGSIQKKLRQYEYSYQNCFWMKNNTDYEKNRPVFFYDNYFKYFLSDINCDKVRNAFDFYLEFTKNIDIHEMVVISEHLFVNDFNLTQTADDLYLHKNTLIYKIKKYEEIFQIDIRGNFQGKFIFTLITQVLKNYQEMVQVGDEV